MIYRPPDGKMWDPSLLKHEGRYYLFSMYNHGTGDTDVWSAASDDGFTGAM